jgi:hypothetical protein
MRFNHGQVTTCPYDEGGFERSLLLENAGKEAFASRGLSNQSSGHIGLTSSSTLPSQALS